MARLDFFFLVKAKKKSEAFYASTATKKQWLQRHYNRMHAIAMHQPAAAQEQRARAVEGEFYRTFPMLSPRHIGNDTIIIIDDDADDDKEINGRRTSADSNSSCLLSLRSATEEKTLFSQR